MIIYLTVTDDQPRFLDIDKHLKQDPVDLLHRVSDLRVLHKKGLIRKYRSYRSDGIFDVNFYFGESEKEVKRLFEKYHKFVEKEDNCPILLFNEADGVLGKRKL